MIDALIHFMSKDRRVEWNNINVFKLIKICAFIGIRDPKRLFITLMRDRLIDDVLQSSFEGLLISIGQCLVAGKGGNKISIISENEVTNFGCLIYGEVEKSC